MEGNTLVKQHLAELHLFIDFIPGISQRMNGNTWHAISDRLTWGLGQYSSNFLLFGLQFINQRE